VGHAGPALAVAEELEDRLWPGAVELVGSKRGSGARLLCSSGIPFTLLAGRGIRRSVSPGASLSNVVALVGLAVAFFRSLALVLSRRPKVIVAFGGFGSIPPALAGWLARVPLVVVNIDAVPGAANRLLGRLARVSAVSVAGTGLANEKVTGAPLRRGLPLDLDDASRTRAKDELGIPPGRKVIGVVGGSLGARRLNEATVGLAALWRERGDLAIYHVTGVRDFPSVKEARRAAAPLVPEAKAGTSLCYVAVPYEDRMGLLYSAADVMVCRGGAMTMAELAALGVPAVVVPLPDAPRDHQRANAEVLERAGAAVMLDDESCTGERLASLLEELLEDEVRLASMARAASALGRPRATEEVANITLELAGIGCSSGCAAGGVESGARASDSQVARSDS